MVVHVPIMMVVRGVKLGKKLAKKALGVDEDEKMSVLDIAKTAGKKALHVEDKPETGDIKQQPRQQAQQQEDRHTQPSDSKHTLQRPQDATSCKALPTDLPAYPAGHPAYPAYHAYAGQPYAGYPPQAYPAYPYYPAYQAYPQDAANQASYANYNYGNQSAVPAAYS